MLDTNEAGSDNVADSATTDASGKYSLSLAAGSYVIVETTKGHPGWTQSYPTNDVLAAGVTNVGHGGYPITLTSGQNLTGNDFGSYRYATTSGVKFNDLNANGKRDSGDPGLAGWQIRAFNDLDGNGVIDTNEAGSDNVAASDTTNASGNYSLSLAPGKYVIVETTRAIPAGPSPIRPTTSSRRVSATWVMAATHHPHLGTDRQQQGLRQLPECHECHDLGRQVRGQEPQRQAR